MSWDIFGDIVGKARRRQIEHSVQTDAAGIVKVDWGVFTTKLAAGALVGVLGAAAHGNLPTAPAALLSLAAGGILAAGPSALQASGLMTAVGPNTLSVASAVGNAIRTVVNAPKAQQQQQMETIAAQAAEAALANWQTKTGAFTKEQLAGDVPLPGSLILADPEVVPLPQHSNLPKPASVPALGGDAAIVENSVVENSVRVMGGNQ